MKIVPVCISYITFFILLFFASLLNSHIVFGADPQLQKPTGTQLVLEITIHQIKINDEQEPGSGEDGEFYFVRKINNSEVRYPQEKYINRKKDETIEPPTASTAGYSFWSTNIPVTNTNSMSVEFKGFEIDDFADDELSVISFTIDMSDFGFVEKYNHRILTSSDYNITLTVSCYPIVSSATHPDTTMTYANSTIALSWEPCTPAVGLIGYSYVLDTYCCTIPDEEPEGTHTVINYPNRPDAIYWFHLRCKDKSGLWSSTAHFRIQISGGTPVYEIARNVRPEHFRLRQNYPNPFNNSTTIMFELDRIEQIHAIIYNSLGQYIATLADAEYLAGPHSLTWNGTDAANRSMPSGIYFCRVTTSHQSKTIQLTLSR
ncbi:T9SS type A sorting domain-containing protein [candidate division KSB1 bacterium]|nr:T9SS type A sorting domain-containing protein [candidate division KSB1 bacterium]